MPDVDVEDFGGVRLNQPLSSLRHPSRTDRDCSTSSAESEGDVRIASPVGLQAVVLSEDAIYIDLDRQKLAPTIKIPRANVAQTEPRGALRWSPGVLFALLLSTTLAVGVIRALVALRF